LAFPEAERIAFVRDVLFPMVGIASGEAARYVHVEHLMRQLQIVQGDVAREYLDGHLEFVRAADRLSDEALAPNGGATLKFFNEYRSYVVTYTAGRQVAAETLAACTARWNHPSTWSCYEEIVTDPSGFVSSNLFNH